MDEPMTMFDLSDVNTMAPGAFTDALGGVLEDAPWIAAAAVRASPFSTVIDLHAALMDVARAAPLETRLSFLRGHPELAGKVARAGAMTAASIAEQGGLGLDRLSDTEFERFEALNTAYREKFGFPFIICVRRHTRDSILSRFAFRLANEPDAEMTAAFDEIGFISRLRLVAAVIGPGMPVTTGRLSTHVVDTVHGSPAAGIRVSLHEIGVSGSAEIVSVVTNQEGRTGAPLIAGEPLRIGTYELRFRIGAYFQGLTADPPFLDEVPVRFAIAEPEAHYHVPLLVSPWGYSTYRGS